MIDGRQACHIALNFIRRRNPKLADELIVSKEPLEKTYGWIIFYSTRTYVETGNYKYALAGNGPLVVDKVTGEIVQLETAIPVADAIREFEERRAQNRI